MPDRGAFVIALEPAVVVQADPQTLYAAAVADRLAGRPASAVRKLEQVLAARPEDVDARLNLGLALLALDRAADAAAAFRGVIAGAPHYVDAHIGLARAGQRGGDLAAARLSVAEALRLAPRNPDALALADSLQVERRWRADATVSRSHLSAGLPDWTEMRLSASRPFVGSWIVGGAVEVTRRFEDTDTYIEVRADHAFRRGSAWLSVGGAPAADHRPEIAVAGGGRWVLAPGLAVTLDATAARYRSGSVTGIHPGLVTDLAAGRVQVSVRMINVSDETGEHRQGYTAQARWQATGRLALRAGFADAPESAEGVTVDVSSWSAGFDLTLSDRLVLRAGHVSEDRGAYDRKEVSAGLGWRF